MVRQAGLLCATLCRRSPRRHGGRRLESRSGATLHALNVASPLQLSRHGKKFGVG